MTKKTQDNPIRFWYPVKTVSQPSLLPGTPAILKDVSQEGHILYQGRLICKQSMEIIKGRLKAKHDKIVSQRETGVKMCKDCLEGYKLIPGTPFYHWVHGKELKNNKEIKINPELRGNDGH